MIRTLLVVSLALPSVAVAGDVAESAIEIGKVEWRRDFDAALVDGAKTGRPVFAFFQEVPGCAGCQRFGRVVMSDPAIVQAVEREFVPVLIYNNRKGKDAELLDRYGEPAWNYQVVRFLDGEGKDLIPRKDRVWTREGIALRMIEALEVAGRDVPRYLEVAAYENDTDRHAQAAFSQHCFWRGEYELGQIPGVVATEAGWLAGREVTLVSYHRDRISLEELAKQAAGTSVAHTMFLRTEAERGRIGALGTIRVGKLDDSYRKASDSDQKKQLAGSVFERLPLSPMQRTKVNSFGPVDLGEALSWLTPEQHEEFERLTAKAATRESR